MVVPGIQCLSIQYYNAHAEYGCLTWSICRTEHGDVSRFYLMRFSFIQLHNSCLTNILTRWSPTEDDYVHAQHLHVVKCWQHSPYWFEVKQKRTSVSSGVWANVVCTYIRMLLCTCVCVFLCAWILTSFCKTLKPQVIGHPVYWLQHWLHSSACPKPPLCTRQASQPKSYSEGIGEWTTLRLWADSPVLVSCNHN